MQEPLPKSGLSKKAPTGCVVIAFGALAIFIIGLLALATCHQGGTALHSRSTSSVGSEHRLRTGGSGQIFVAVDEDAFRELTKAAVAKDYLGMADLEVRGRIFGVDQGTRVLPIDSGFAKTKVRILEGKGLGRSGWVPYEFVN